MARRKKRRKKRGRLGNRLGIVAVLVLVLLALALLFARHFRHGGTLSGLQDVVAPARDWVAAHLPQREPPEPREIPPPFPPQPDAFADEGLYPPPSVPPEAIGVYFAPNSPEDPAGVDDVLLALIASAQFRIDCAFYGLELMSVAEALIAKHRVGVPVRLVSDSDYDDVPGILACIAAGVPVVFDERSALMHNKFCVVDGRYVWTGSTNITENGFFRNNNNALLIDAPRLAENYAAEFVEMFELRAFGARSPRNTPHPTLLIGDTWVACYFAPEDEPEQVIVALVGEAQSSIDFMAFSFTSRPIADAMHRRLRAGVAVRGIFETRNAGSSYSRDDFLAAQGAEIYLDDNPHSMHHKVIVVDSAVVVTGSYNFSKSAAESNDENVLILKSGRIAAAFTAEFERLIPQ